MSKRWIVHTLDSLKARCDEEGDCWIWKGATCGDRGKPVMRRNGKNVSPRRVVRELADGEPIPAHLECAATCGNKMCISPHCSVVVSHKTRARMAAKKGAYDNPTKGIKVAMTMRAKSRISEETIKYILSSGDSGPKIALETGVSRSYVSAIRRGVARKNYASPFAGLI